MQTQRELLTWKAAACKDRGWPPTRVGPPQQDEARRQMLCWKPTQSQGRAKALFLASLPADGPGRDVTAAPEQKEP